MGPQHRLAPLAEFRATPDGVEGRFEAIVLRYQVLDDFETKFAKGVFNESMDKRMPRIVWGHDWRQVLGRWTQYKEVGNTLRMTGQFDDFDAVPMARQAFHQLVSGTVDQFSVGFVPTEWTDGKEEGSDREVRTFIKGRLDEVSLVLVGAVPDTELLSVRSGLKLIVRQPLISKEAAADVLLRLHLGEVDLADALMELKSMEVTKNDDDDDDGGAGTPPPAADSTGGTGQADEVDPAVKAAADVKAAQDAAAEVAAAAKVVAQAELDELLEAADEALALVDDKV